MVSYDKDHEAGAVVLFDIGEAVFYKTDKGDYDIRFTRVKRIKILDQTAYDYAEISIPFYVDGYGRTEVIKSIKAFTYNILEDGYVERTELDQSSVFEEIINDRWRRKKFVFPDVKDGSVLEFRYVLETPFHFNLPDWSFQDRIPTIYSEYTARMIPFYEYIFIVQGISSFDYQKSVVGKQKRTWGNLTKGYGKNIGDGIEFQDYIHTYALKDVPAFKDEAYITSINDYIVKMDFQLAKLHSPNGGVTEIMSTWPEFNKALFKHDNFGKYLKSCTRYAKKVFESDLDIAGKEENEISDMIVDYVKSNFTWNGNNSIHTSKSAKEFFNQKTGNSADINLFLLSLFNFSGFDAHPVVLSTRNHGKINIDYPFEHFFNYVIVYVNTNNPFLADGTENYLPYNRIPPRCINEKGLVVSKDDVKWVILDNNIPSLEKISIKTKIDQDKPVADFVISINATEYEAYKYKESHHNDTTSIKEFYLEKVDEINRVKTLNYDKSGNPYMIFLEGETNIEKIGNHIIVSPFLNLAMSQNKLTQKVRTYPVDLIYPSTKEFSIELEIPSGFKLIDVPESYGMDNDLVEIALDYQTKENIVDVNASYTFKKSIYETNEYNRLKAYMNIIVKKFNEQIVLEKIN